MGEGEKVLLGVGVEMVGREKIWDDEASWGGRKRRKEGRRGRERSGRREKLGDDQSFRSSRLFYF